MKVNKKLWNEIFAVLTHAASTRNPLPVSDGVRFCRKYDWIQYRDGSYTMFMDMPIVITDTGRAVLKKMQGAKS